MHTETSSCIHPKDFCILKEKLPFLRRSPRTSSLILSTSWLSEKILLCLLCQTNSRHVIHLFKSAFLIFIKLSPVQTYHCLTAIPFSQRVNTIYSCFSTTTEKPSTIIKDPLPRSKDKEARKPRLQGDKVSGKITLEGSSAELTVPQSPFRRIDEITVKSFPLTSHTLSSHISRSNEIFVLSNCFSYSLFPYRQGCSWRRERSPLIQWHASS